LSIVPGFFQNGVCRRIDEPVTASHGKPEHIGGLHRCPVEKVAAPIAAAGFRTAIE